MHTRPITDSTEAKAQTQQARRLPLLWPWLLVGAAWTTAGLSILFHQIQPLDHHYLLEESHLPWVAALVLFLAGWQVMTVAMMLPSSLPMVSMMVYTSRKQPRPV